MKLAQKSNDTITSYWRGWRQGRAQARTWVCCWQFGEQAV